MFVFAQVSSIARQASEAPPRGDEDEPRRVYAGLPCFPAFPMSRNVRTFLLAGECGFF